MIMSNEKREQQMMAAADRYADEVCDESCTGAQVSETINDFCAGWRAADSHPAWVSVEERLPEENTAPIVCIDLSDKFGEETILYDSVVYDGNGFHTPYKVTHWMQITPPVKKGGEQ